MAVSITKALDSLLDLGLSRHEVANLACFIEIEKLGMPIGFQDQFAASYGGLNAIYFSNEGVSVEPLKVSSETLKSLEKSILLFFMAFREIPGQFSQTKEIFQYKKQ